MGCGEVTPREPFQQRLAELNPVAAAAVARAAVGSDAAARLVDPGEDGGLQARRPRAPPGAGFWGHALSVAVAHRVMCWAGCQLANQGRRPTLAALPEPGSVCPSRMPPPCVPAGAAGRAPRLSARQAERRPDGDAEVSRRPDGDLELPGGGAGFVVPPCDSCGGVLKPNVVFFGDAIPQERAARCAPARAPPCGTAAHAAAHAAADVDSGSLKCQRSGFGSGAAEPGPCGRGAAGRAGRLAARSCCGELPGPACCGRSAEARSCCVICSA